MEWESDERELKAAGAELLPEGRRGLRIHGWEIESRRRSILTSLQLQQYSFFPFYMCKIQLSTDFVFVNATCFYSCIISNLN